MRIRVVRGRVGRRFRDDRTGAALQGDQHVEGIAPLRPTLANPREPQSASWSRALRILAVVVAATTSEVRMPLYRGPICPHLLPGDAHGRQHSGIPQSEGAPTTGARG